MKWKDIDLRHHVLHIPRSKTGPARDVPLSEAAETTIRGLPRRIDGWLLDSPSIAADNLSKRFLTAARAAGIEDLKFHDLRHEATSRFFEKGLDIMEVTSITGHRTLAMLRRYTHLKARDLARKIRG